MNLLKLSQVKNLFWEYDLSDLQKADSSFIIERVLEKGSWSDLKIIFQNYSSEEILNVISTSNNLSSTTKNFWINYFNSGDES